MKQFYMSTIIDVINYDYSTVAKPDVPLCFTSALMLIMCFISFKKLYNLSILQAFGRKALSIWPIGWWFGYTC